MSITISCQCGKQLRLKDEAAGKRIRCPGCGAALLVAAARDEAVEHAESPEEFLRSLSEQSEGPPARAQGAEGPPPPAEPFQPQTSSFTAAAPPQIEQQPPSSSTPEVPVPIAHEDDLRLALPTATARMRRHDRTAGVAVLILRVFAWLGVAAALVHVAITVVSVLLVAATAESEARAGVTTLFGLFGLGSTLVVLFWAALWWALFIALASITENLVEIRRNSKTTERRGLD